MTTPQPTGSLYLGSVKTAQMSAEVSPVSSISSASDARYMRWISRDLMSVCHVRCGLLSVMYGMGTLGSDGCHVCDSKLRI